MDSVSRELLETVSTGLMRGEYSLLLGAGASLGCIGGNGQPLPSGPDLCEALLSEFAIDGEGEALSLSVAYQLAQDTHPERLRHFITSWFTDCKPTWQSLLITLPWHRIWTLNIDDVVEQAFSAGKVANESVSWTHRFRDHRNGPRQIVHLHGRASDLLNQNSTCDSPLVFTIPDYVAATTGARSWHTVFKDEFTERPFLILGARLADEFDLSPALEQGSFGDIRGYPTVLVVPEISNVRRDQLERKGIQIVLATAQEAMRLVAERHSAAMADEEGPQRQLQAMLPFMQQFIDLRTFQPTAAADARTFLGGGEPLWLTITTGVPAMFHQTRDAAASVVDQLRSERAAPRMITLHGAAATGKSTAMLQIAQRLLAERARPCLFRNEQSLDIEASVRWLKSYPETVLLFDNAADFSDDIDRLLQTCREKALNPLVVVAERSSRLPNLRRGISSAFQVPQNEFVFGSLNDSDIDNLLAKLHEYGRLGRLTRLPHLDQVAYFRSYSRRHFFDAMANLELSGQETWLSRLRSSFRQISNDNQRMLYACACMCFDFGITMSPALARRVARVDAATVRAWTERGSLAQLLWLDRSGLRPRHRVTADMVVHTILTSDERYDVSLRLATELARTFTPASISDKTRDYRIARQLLLHRNVNGLVGVKARAWYDEIRPMYEWNGRYWEQRALLESALSDHGAARSFAERSVAVHRHPYALNTLGTVLLHAAVERGSSDELTEAVAALEDARDWPGWRYEPSEHPYVTFFSLTLRFAEKWGLDAVPAAARRRWNEWLTRAYHAPFVDQVAVTEWQHRWLALGVVRPSADVAQESRGGDSEDKLAGALRAWDALFREDPTEALRIATELLNAADECQSWDPETVARRIQARGSTSSLGSAGAFELKVLVFAVTYGASTTTAELTSAQAVLGACRSTIATVLDE